MGRAQGAAETGVRVGLAERHRSQRWLADQLGVSTYWVSARMTGRVAFDMDDLDRIAQIFGVEVGDLLYSRAVAA